MPASAMTGLADRVTAALEAGRAAVRDLDDAVATGAPVNQASVNTLQKVLADLGQVAADARRGAAGETAASAPAPAAPADAGTASAKTGSTPGATGSGSAASAKP